MNYLVLLVLNDPDLSDAVLNAWETAGVRGVTILESSGIGRYRQASLRDDLPLMPSLRDLLRGRETHHRTFFSIVEGDAQVEQLARVTQAVTGDFSQPNTGVLFAMPLSHVYGLNKTSVR